MNRHDARLVIASDVDKGSSFSCRFPAASAMRRERAEPAMPAVATSR
jgi:two-component system phosphate regulon sensor histidine kinase PhoR